MSKKKGEARSRTLSKRKFKRIVCQQQCLLCDSNKPSFCYPKYASAPNKFMEILLPTLIMHNHTFSGIVTNEAATGARIFQNMFKRLICDTGICKNCPASRKQVEACMTHFLIQAGYLKNQIQQQSPSKKIFRIINNKPVKKKTPPPPPKPFVIMSGNQEFTKEVQKILENYPEEQNQAGGAITSS